MSASSPLAPFAALKQVALSSQPTLAGQRLLARLEIEVYPSLFDSDDDDRRLLASQLTALEADLLLHEADGPLLVCGLRCVSTLPISSERRARAATVLLAADLDPATAVALQARADVGRSLQLRGQVLRWINPLFDEQGYQHTRVGDKGMSRVVQAMGELRLDPLVGGAVDL